MIFNLAEKEVTIYGDNCFIAENAVVIGSVAINNNVSIWFNAVVRGDMGDITIGEGTNIQDGSVLHTDEGKSLIIGSNVTVGHKAVLHGCTINDHCIIGVHSVILNDAHIGKYCIIGANTLIPEGKIIPDNSLVMGSPGKIVKPVSEMQLQDIEDSYRQYIKKINYYKDSLMPIH